MKLKQFFTDDDAVSPVIGVILMVAITVILAAVIASFVLGLGQSTGNTAPQASFDWDYSEEGSVSTLTIALQNGELDPEEISIKGDFGGGSSSTVQWSTVTTSDLTAGDQITITSDTSGDVQKNNLGPTFDLSVIWTPSEGGDSSTLSTQKGPEA